MMKSFTKFILTLCLPTLTVVLLSGCAQNKQAIARLEQENAQQRERIWRSNMKMEDFRRENESLRQQVETLRGSGRTSGSASNTASNPAFLSAPSVGSYSAAPSTVSAASPSAIPSAAPSAVPAASTSGAASTANSSVVVPTVAPNPPASSLGTPSNLQNEPLNPPAGSRVSMNGSGNSSQPVHVRKTDSRNVYSVVLLPQKTRPINYEGIHVEFQLKDSAGNIILAPAPLEVFVTDPSKPKEQSRISWWVYTAEDVADIINGGRAGLSIPLDMRWAKSCPSNMNLELHILYQTSDKRLLINRVPINLAQNAYSTPSTLALESPNPQVGSDAPAPSASFPSSPSSAPSESAKLERPSWSPTP